MSRKSQRSIEALFQSSLNLLNPGDQGEKLHAVGEQIRQALGADWAGFVLLAGPQNTLTDFILSGVEDGEIQAPASETFIEACTNTSRCLTGSQESYQNAQTLFTTLFSAEKQGNSDFNGLVEPLTYCDQLFGLVAVARRHAEPKFEFEDWKLLAIVAYQASLAIHDDLVVSLEQKQHQQAAIAIENARLYSSAQHQINQLDALQETIADISAELELPRLLQAILKRAVVLLNTTGGDLGLYDEANNEIQVVASYNMGKDFSGTRMSVGEGAMGLALKTGQPVIVDDYQTWNNASSQYHEYPIHAVLAVPFTFGSRTIGVIAVVEHDPNHKFSVAEQHLLNLFAQHAAIAVENARLYQAAREAADRREILHQVSQKIVAASLDLQGIYAAIHNATTQLMPADAFVITLYDEKNQTINDAYVVDLDGHANLRSFPADQGLSGKVISSGQTIYIEDLENDPDKENYLHFGETGYVRSVLAVPMILRGKVTGMLSTQSYTPRAFTSDDRSLIELLASYAAIAIENARLFSRIQQLAITDPLTGVMNRRQLFEMGRLEFLRAIRFKHALSVIMMDIDHFKLVNDHLGHAAGDVVLCRLAKLVRTEVRAIDLVGRYGGEEFTLVLPETSLAMAGEVAERLRKKINTIFSTANKTLPQITVSIGVASLEPDSRDFEDLVNRADQALYAAKDCGRDRVMILPPD